MSNFPTSLDDDTTLPFVNDNLTEIGGDAINAVRDATFALEENVGIGAAGSTLSIADRIGVSLNPDGTIKPSALTSLGLVTLPITQDQIATNAQIPESKLRLDFRTQDLFNYIRDLAGDVNTAIGWISTSGVKLEAHLIGALYRHTMDQIDVSTDLAHFPFLNNKFRTPRDNTSAYTVVNGINDELLQHQWADGSPFGIIQNVTTNNGSTFPSNYAHLASGIFLNTTRFAVIPQTADDVQSFADFIDNASILTLGTRIQNFYQAGISRNSRSSSLTADGYGQALVPATPAIAYLRGNGNNSIPIDDIAIGEDIIQFMPDAGSLSSNIFDEQFALVRPGDIVRVNYAADGYNIEIPFVISEKKYIQGGGNKIFIVRIAGKNIAYAPNALARIDRPLFNNNKHGVLAVAGVDSPTTVLPSLIIGAPRGAQCLGIDFSPDEFNETHYNLYIALYTTGNPLDGYNILPAIDVTGDQGTTPGSYTLDSVVAATNSAFRQPGFNYRFIAFKHEGNFGIMLADSINNASFSVISAVVSGAGFYNQAATQLNFPNNVIDVFPALGDTAPDPTGFLAAGLASPPFQKTYGSPEAASLPTYLFVPLRRNNYYIDGTERELLNLDVGQVLDTYGDGYWIATVDGYSNNAGPPGHTTVTYSIPLDLSASKLKAGKTIVVQSVGKDNGLVNYGRFIIQSVTFSCCPPIQTQITVYDGVHATGVSPSIVAPAGSQAGIYFSASSVSFNTETATDFSAISAAFKRHFEVYVDKDGNTFTHERGRISVNGTITVNGVQLYSSINTLGQMDIVSISPKLRGFQVGSLHKITLQISSFDVTTGLYTGNLASFDGVTFAKQGPVTTGKVGEVTRFYDQSNVDYIDIIFEFGNTVPNFTDQYIDFQLFPTLALDQEIMLIASCQERSDTNTVSQIVDLRQFGNISAEELSTSALNFLSLPDRVLHFNGPVRGFDATDGYYTNSGLLSLKGGLALINGNLLEINDQQFIIPPLQEIYLSVAYPINYALCVNAGGELVTIVLTDFDSALGTPNAPSRLVTVKNAFSGNSYQIDSNTFSNILNGRKDLTVLYIVSATVTGSGSSSATTIVVRDVRRFVKDSDSNVPAVLTSADSQGNFKTLAAALNWLKFNSAFQKTLVVKGAFSISTDPGLNFPLEIIGGGSTAALVFNSNMNMSNVTFSDVTVTFNGALTATDVEFHDCTINFNGSTTLNNVFIDPSIVNVNALVSNTGTAVVRDTTINVSIAQGFAISSGLQFVGCTFNYTYNPVGGSPTYSTADLVNAGSGMMYTNILGTGIVDGFSVERCEFNNFLSDHFPFISMQLGGTLGDGYGAIAQNVIIAGNKFNNQVVSNDRRAVISITSTILNVTSPPTGYPPIPKLVNISISDNVCDYDQIILLSTVRPVTSLSPIPMTGAMLVCTNCSISNNVCGVIGYMTAGDLSSNGDNSQAANVGTIRDKTDQLVIDKNTCKLITNLDATGQYIPFKATETTNIDWVQVSTGACAIERNTCNWILVGCSAWRAGISYPTINAQGIRISRNRLSVYDPNFLNAYKDSSNSNITPPAMGILLRASAFNQLDFSAAESIISENILDNRTYLESIGPVLISYEYTAGIKCEASANIYGNIVGAVINNAVAPMILLGGTSSGGPIIKCHDNTLNRNGSTVGAYVQALNSNAINAVVITNNVFDAPTIDGVSTATGLNIPALWTFHSNINQTAYLSISPTDHANYSVVGGPGVLSSQKVNSNTGGGARGADIIYDDTTSHYRVARLLPYIFGFPPAGFGTAGQYMIISDYNATSVPAVRNYSFTVPLDYNLPMGVKVISVNMGIWLQIGGVTLDTGTNVNNQYTLTLVAYNPTTTSNSANGVIDIKNNISFFFGGISDNSENFTTFLQSSFFVGGSTTSTQRQVSDLTGSTQYMNITTSQIGPLQEFYTVDGKHRLAAFFDLNYLRSGVAGASDFVTWYVSPIVVEYRW